MSPARATPDRPWLDRLLNVVRQLGATQDLGDLLNLISIAGVEALGFDSVAIQVDDGNGSLVVESANGNPDEVERVLGKRIPITHWKTIFDECESWGELLYLHRSKQYVFEGLEIPIPEVTPSDDPNNWHPGDALFAPMYAPDGQLLGVISVEPPSTAPVPSQDRLTVLELFAAQAARAIVEARERTLAEERHHEMESRWRLAFESSPVGACIVDTDGFIREANTALSSMLGYSREDILGRHPTEFMYPDDAATWNEGPFMRLVSGEIDHYEMERRYRTADGELLWTSLHVGTIRSPDGTPLSIVSQIMDITARKHAEAQLTYRASHDSLTNLPNRSATESLLAAALKLSHPTGVLYCDLDRFKIINDSLGHDAGDDLLVEVVERLRSAVPADCTLARVGGDEFVVLAPGIHDIRRLAKLGEALRGALASPFRVRGHSHTVNLSVGVTISQPWHQHPDEVLREADQAMLRAKRHGRSRVEQYDPNLDKHATVADLDLENELRMALAEGRDLRPYFQPILSLSTDHFVGSEALVRWHHAERGLMDPGAFLAMAEASGLIIPLGWWMLEVSCRAASRATAETGHLWVAVNVSGRQLGRGQLPSAVRRALDLHDLPGDRLHIELTENTLVEASAVALDELRQVAELGVTIALDDFGTGYSSLSLLKDLPVGMVKIDRSFVSPVADPHGPAVAIVSRLVALCGELGITTVAEGVESEEQLEVLRNLGCDHAQGYLIGAPEPADRFGAAAAARKRAI